MPRRQRKTGSIFWNGTKFWLQFYQDGRRVRVNSGSADRAVAEQVLAEKLARVTLKQPLVARAAMVRYEELRKDLVTYYQTRGTRDLPEVTGRLTHLDAFFRGVRAEQITAARITEYIAQRQAAGAQNSTVNREVSVLLRMLRLGVQHDKVARVPIIEKPKEAPPREGFVEHEAFEAIRAHLPVDLQAAVLLAFTLGWRMQSDVLGLQVRQVDLRAGELRLDVGQDKNERGRVIVLTDQLRPVLAAQIERVVALERQLGRVIPWLFPHLGVKGRHTRRALIGTAIRDFRKAWRSALKAAGYTGLLRHDLRRSGVRNMVRAGVTEGVAMKISGHRTRSVFERYNITSARDLAEAAQKMSLAIPTAITAPVAVLAGKRKTKRTRG
jgi:integrase